MRLDVLPENVPEQIVEAKRHFPDLTRSAPVVVKMFRPILAVAIFHPSLLIPMKPVQTLLVCAVLALASCDQNPNVVMPSPESHTFQLATPEPGFKLDPKERARVAPMFDVEALEKLLAMIRPNFRKEILTSFQLPLQSGQHVGQIVHFKDPALQEILEEVWAPAWLELGPEAIVEDELSPIPGREIARQRLQARGIKLD